MTPAAATPLRLAAADPNREAIERGDEQLRASQPLIIDDPTVFVKSAALGALTLIELAKLGQSHAQDPKLREFAAAVARRQAALRAELAAIATKERLDVPDSLVYQDEQMLQEGAGKSGADFAAWFVRHAVEEHFRSVDLYEAAKGMKNARLAAFARRSLPLLDQDRLRALSLQSP